MSNTIDKIRVNGTDYDVGGSGGDLIEQYRKWVFSEIEFRPTYKTYSPDPFFDLENQYTESGILLKDAFVDGETYIVTFDGIEYECVAHLNSNSNAVFLGNHNIGMYDGGRYW